MRRVCRNILASLFLVSICLLENSSCIFDNKKGIFSQDTSHYKNLRAYEDSIRKEEAVHRRKLEEHPFEMESGHIVYLARQKSGSDFSTVRIIEFSFEEFGKIQLYEEKFSGFDFKTMKSKDVYTFVQIKNDTQIVVLNPNSKKKFYTRTSISDFDFVFDSAMHVQFIKPTPDTLDGIPLFRYDVDVEKKSYKVLGGLVLFQSMMSGDFVLEPSEIKWNYKIPAKKLEIPADYQ